MLFLIKLAVATIVTFLLSWLPLVGAYDYEAALCVALIGVVFVPIMAPAKTDDAKAWTGYLFGSAIMFWLFANLATLGVAWFHNEMCDLTAGIKYQLLISLPAALFAAAVWGWSNALSRFKVVRLLTYLLVVALDFGVALTFLYHFPPLVAFGHFFGYFAGSIYDEAIHVTQSLCLYRVGTLLLALCFLIAQAGTPSLARKLLSPLAGMALAAGWQLMLSHFELIPPIGRSALEDTLWMTVSAPDKAWTVHFTPESKHRAYIAEKAKHIDEEYSRDFALLENFFKNRPSAPIHIWLYSDYDQKARFLAARNTSFARVWKHEIHLVEDTPRSTTPRHEMAHLFAEQFGNRPLGLAGAGGIPAMGWVEGLAMAAQWRQNEFDLHTWSAAIFDAQILENSDIHLTPNGLLYGFWSLPAPIAYTLAGSYTRWLIDKFGIEKIKQLTQTTPSEFEEIIGISHDDSFEAWKQDIRSSHANARARELAGLLFGRPSIWSKHCARNAAARSASFMQCLNDAKCHFETLESCAFQEVSAPTSADKLPEFTSLSLRDMNAVWALYTLSDPMVWPNYALFSDPNTKNMTSLTPAQYRAWLSRAHELLANDITSPKDELIWAERNADMMWDAGFNQVAAIMYSALLTQTLPRGLQARLEFKRQAAFYEDSAISRAMHTLLTTSDEELIDLIYNAYDDAPSIAFFELQSAVDSRKYDRARHAFMQILMNYGTTDPASKLPNAALPLLVDLMKWL